MNGIGEKRARAEIGDQGVDLTGELARHLGATEIDYRFGPSLIVRSESELLGFSDPRFCIRAYLKNGGRSHGFLNLRRIARLESRIPEHLVDADGQPRKIGRPFADCLIEASDSLDTEFHILSSKLWAANGETLPKRKNAPESDRPATPFVQHTLICGGLCAQATAFMVACLLRGYAEAIHGISEITYYAKGLPISGRDQKLPIGGLDVRAMASYFDFIGLNAQENLSPSLNDLPGPDSKPVRAKRLSNDRPVDLFEQGIRAYLFSGFPVVLPVDIARLDRNGVYRHNNWSPEIDCKPGKDAKHAVVVVGCSRSSRQGEFLINDPATVPFLKASAAELFNSGVLLPLKDGQSGDLRFFNGYFVPVVPSKVQVPFLDDPKRNQSPLINRLDERLKWLAYQFKKDRPELIRPALISIRDEFAKSLRLVNLDRLSDLDFAQIGRSEMWKRFRKNAAEIGRKIAALQSWRPDQWVWVDRTGDLIWIYNAEIPRVSDSAFDELLIYQKPGPEKARAAKAWGIFEFDTPGSARSKASPASPSRQAGSSDGGGKKPASTDAKKNRPEVDLSKLMPSLITSFTVHGLASAFKEKWIGKETGAEIYAFMHGDFDEFPNPGEGHQIPSVSRLASLGDGIDSVAKNIDRIVGKRKIHALASFVPEISHPRKVIGRQALEVLIRLAGKLRSEFKRKDLQIVEAVAGSRFSQIRENGNEVLEVTLRSSNAVLRTLLLNLLKLESVISEAGVTIALELEPGPLYGLSDLDSLRALCSLLKDDDKFAPLRKCVGFNLDIAHWGLIGKIDPDVIEDDHDIYSRIVHAHISDHDRAHFADCPIHAIHDAKDGEFRRWLELYGRRFQDNDRFDLQCSGVVSVELEACRDVESRDRSVKELLKLLGRS